VASRRGPKAENVDLRPTAAVPAAARAKTSLTGVRPRVSYAVIPHVRVCAGGGQQ